MSRITIFFSSILFFVVCPHSLIASGPSLDSLARSDSLLLKTEDKIVPDSLHTETVVDSILDYAEELLGTPYRFKNSKRNIQKSLNCSQFIAHIFGKFGYEIPSTSLAQSKLGEAVTLPDIRKGDLLFFSGRNTRSRLIGHVSLVIDTGDSGIKMIHSTRRGVVIDDYDDSPYYKKRLLKARRLDLHPPDETLTGSQ